MILMGILFIICIAIFTSTWETITVNPNEIYLQYITLIISGLGSLITAIAFITLIFKHFSP